MTKVLEEGTDMNATSCVVPRLPNKSKMAVAAIFNFGKNVNNSELDKNCCTNFYGKILHGHAKMTTWQKVEIGS